MIPTAVTLSRNVPSFVEEYVYFFEKSQPTVLILRQ
jgi:hypothetical protein